MRSKIMIITKCFTVLVLLFLFGCFQNVNPPEIFGPYKNNGFLIRKQPKAVGERGTLTAYNENLEKVWEIKEGNKLLHSNYTYKREIIIKKYIDLYGDGFMGIGCLRSADNYNANFFPAITYYDRNKNNIGTKIIEQNGELHNAIKLPDGDYVACGGQRQWPLTRQERGIITRFSPYKSVKWFKIIPESGAIHQILLTSDNKILLVGHSFSPNYLNEKLYVGKYSLKGTKIWELIDDIGNGDEFVNTFPSIIMTRNGDYIIGGNFMGGEDDKSFFYTRISKHGRNLWKRIIKPKHDSAFSIGPTIYDIELLPNKSFLVAGCWKPYSNYGFLSKMDLNGNEIWTIDVFYNERKSVPRYINKNSDRSYSIYGFSKSSEGDEEIWSLKLDKNGEVVKK